jgi:ArsR family transcriptional regulator
MRDLIKLFKAFSDPTRLRIVRLLMEGELCVCELENILEISQSCISHQLQILKGAYLVKDRRMGKWVVYSLEDNPYLSALSSSIKDWIKREEVIREDLKMVRKCLNSNLMDRCKRLEGEG